MSNRLLSVLADFLDLVADSTEPVEIGQVGPPGRYTPRESKAIGPAVFGLAARQLIAHADAQSSSRRTRHGAIVRRWLPLSRDACRRKAEELRRRAESLDDDGSDIQQLKLF